jgi:hypothetical protein
MKNHDWLKLSFRAFKQSVIHAINAVWCFAVWLFWLPKSLAKRGNKK